MGKEIKSINDIKSGYLVETRNGNLYMCMRSNQEKFDKILIDKNNRFLYFGSYIELKTKYKGPNCFDIIKVYGLSSDPLAVLSFSTKDRPLLYKEELKEMTIEQIEKN